MNLEISEFKGAKSAFLRRLVVGEAISDNRIAILYISFIIK